MGGPVRKEEDMRYTGGYRRNAANRTKERIPEHGEDAKAIPKRRPDGERLLFSLGILAVALCMAVPLNRSGGSHPEGTADPRAAVAVMSTAEDTGEEEVRDQTGDRETSTDAEESVFDVIGRFFAGLITGG